jgi:hypothetical protein
VLQNMHSMLYSRVYINFIKIKKKFIPTLTHSMQCIFIAKLCMIPIAMQCIFIAKCIGVAELLCMQYYYIAKLYDPYDIKAEMIAPDWEFNVPYDLPLHMAVREARRPLAMPKQL